MGLLIDGQWHDKWYETDATQGRFEREASRFRQQISADSDDAASGFEPEAGRYHLYVSLACPWAHRTLIMRRLKGLESLISVDVVDALMLDHGWTLNGTESADAPQAELGSGDSLYASEYLHQIYTRAKSDYSGRVTVPVLWDKTRQTIVNNESAEIIRMFNSAFDAVGAAEGDYYPEPLRAEIDAINEQIYSVLNNGVYQAGFATSQAAYDEAIEAVFLMLETLEKRLSTQRYLVGNQLTEADIRLYTTLVRFDPVYVTHFRCDRKRIADFPALSGYLRDLYQQPAFGETTDIAHIRGHYFRSHRQINPQGIVPTGPELDLTAPHNREHLG